MHLCRDRGFPDLLEAIRRLLGWENARGAEERDFFVLFPAVTVMVDIPIPKTLVI